MSRRSRRRLARVVLTLLPGAARTGATVLGTTAGKRSTTRRYYGRLVRWVFVLATSLAMLACARHEPSPQPSRAATNTAPAPPPPGPPAPAPPPERTLPCDDALIERVAAGAAPLGELWAGHCADVDKAFAILTARTTPSLTGFVTARRGGTAVLPSLFDDDGSTRVSWEGTCVASVDEMLPSSNGPLPTECLADAKVSEQELPTELNDVRADFLFKYPALLRRWRSCREQTPAETCLDRLLPSTGGDSDRDPNRQRWIAGGRLGQPRT